MEKINHTQKEAAISSGCTIQEYRNRFNKYVYKNGYSGTPTKMLIGSGANKNWPVLNKDGGFK